jgi:hypothetical protein
MDADEYCFTYRGCIVMCDPTMAPGGGFVANAVIVRGDETLMASTPSDIPFLSPESAFEFARDWTIRWIDANVG